jgi:uroporphyrinogen decarboxylase
MTHRLLVQDAIHFNNPERIPHYLPDKQENDLIWLWFPSPEPQQDWHPKDDSTDIMTDAWGTQFYRAKHGTLGRGEVYQPAMHSIEHQDTYEFPDLHQPRFVEPVRTRIQENNRDETPKYCLGVLPFSSLNEGTHNLVGMQAMMMAYYQHPNELKAFIARLASKQRESIQICADIGCDGVMGYDDWGLQSSLMVSKALIYEFFMPHYEANWQFARTLGLDVWLHSCGYILDILPDFHQAGLTVIQQDQQENMGLERLAETVGGKLSFWCPVDIQNTMIHGTLEQIDVYCKRMIQTLGSFSGGFVSMAYSTPDDINHTPERIQAMCNAFRKYERCFRQEE